MARKFFKALLLFVVIIAAAVFLIHGYIARSALDTRYPDIDWSEKERLYEKFIVKSDILPEYYVNLKVVTDLRLNEPRTPENKNNPTYEYRLLFSYDYRKNHYLVYADAEWRSNKIVVTPLYTELRNGDTSALALRSQDFAPDGEAVFFCEVYDPHIISVKTYSLAKTEPDPIYISRNYDLQNGGLMVQENVTQLWLCDADGNLRSDSILFGQDKNN